jgi:hypothetical protein
VQKSPGLTTYPSPTAVLLHSCQQLLLNTLFSSTFFYLRTESLSRPTQDTDKVDKYLRRWYRKERQKALLNDMNRMSYRRLDSDLLYCCSLALFRSHQIDLFKAEKARERESSCSSAKRKHSKVKVEGWASISSHAVLFPRVSITNQPTRTQGSRLLQ